MDPIDHYLQQGKAEGWSAKTVEAYTERLRYAAEFLGKTPWVDIKPRDLEAFMTWLRKKGWKRESRRSVASTLRRFFRWLAENGKILTNPARDLAIEHEAEIPLPALPLSVEEVAALLDSLPRRNVLDLRNRALMELLYGCGLRLAEAVALDLADLDLTNKTLFVRKGKGSKERDLPLGRGAVHALRDYLALRRSLLRGPDSGALFLHRSGKRITEVIVRGLFQTINKRRGGTMRKVHPHLLRHSIAVHLLQNGADIRYVQQFLGHAKLDTTKIYLRLVPGRLKEDYEKAFPDISVV